MNAIRNGFIVGKSALMDGGGLDHYRPPMHAVPCAGGEHGEGFPLMEGETAEERAQRTADEPDLFQHDSRASYACLLC
jgi:hypothetical protein